MKKVMLVDDEILIRESIRDCIHWEQEGFIYSGDASDGEVALPMIEQLQPDILITDIKMPFMNGLELSTIVRKQMPNIKIIILSGHDEFEYARTALRLGVEDYCLKPFSSSDIIQLLHTVSAKIDIERHDDHHSWSMQDQAVDTLDSTILLDRNSFIDFLKIGSPSEVTTTVQQFAHELQDMDWKSSYYGYYILNDLTLEVLQVAKNSFRYIQETELTQQQLQQCIKKVQSWEEACSYLILLAEQFWQWRSAASDRYTPMLAEVKAYIHKNYNKDHLSLQDVAEHALVSPSHLSKVFSQETGQTFIDYLTHTRINKAKELLQSTNAKTYEIAYQVGYNDAPYFSNLFKKITGMTTREFRRKGQFSAKKPV